MGDKGEKLGFDLPLSRASQLCLGSIVPRCMRRVMSLNCGPPLIDDPWFVVRMRGRFAWCGLYTYC